MDLPVVCPAADRLAGPPGRGPAVVCKVLAREEKVIDSLTGGAPVSPLLTAREDPSTVANACCGTGMVRCHEDEEPRAHYTFCLIWQAAQEADAARRERLFGEERGPTSVREALERSF